jgi:RNA polymerase sigma-70 factor (ECF subfamily)
MSSLSVTLQAWPAEAAFGGMAPAALDFDAELMVRVREGDDASFSILLERHRDTVVRCLHRTIQNRAIAEELAQETFLRVYRNRATYQPTAKFKTWTLRIATNLALNWLRDNRKERGQASLDEDVLDRLERQVADRRPTREQELLKEVKLREVRRAVQALPPKQRLAVLLHKYEGLDYERIAEALGCTEVAVKSLMFRAYERLRTRLTRAA